MSLIGDLFDGNRRELHRHQKTVRAINDLEAELSGLGEEGLRHRFDQLRVRSRDGEDLKDLAVESFAIGREAVRRTLGIRLHDLQLAGALVVAGEEIAQMAGGEGKTVSATLAASFWALDLRGVHIFTVDETQAREDAARLGAVYHSLGLSVGVLLTGPDEGAVVDVGAFAEPAVDGLPATLRGTSRREAYECDVTYGTFAQFAGDYLQDQMVSHAERQVQRGLAAAIVDDADHVLLGGGYATTLAASRSTRESERFSRLAHAAGRLREGFDFAAGGDPISLLPSGREALGRSLHAAGLDDRLGAADLADITLVLRAGTHVRRGRPHAVVPGSLFLIDLDPAVPGAPALPVHAEWEVWGRIGVPSLLRLYESLGGLAGTGLSSATTLDTHYELNLVPIPRSTPLQRDDRPESGFTDTEQKLEAVAAEAGSMRARGRPVVIGTTTRATRLRLAEKLRDRGLADVQDPSDEGGPSLTVVTGRPAHLHPDVLPAEVRERGGLHVIGAEHALWSDDDEALRDLAGRRGQPGSTHFFSCGEDPTLRVGARNLAPRVAEALAEGSDPDLLADAVEELQQHREETRVSIAHKMQLRLEREDTQREHVYDQLDEVRDAAPRRVFDGMVRTVIEESVDRWCGDALEAGWAERLVADLADVFPLGDGAQIPEEHLGDAEPDLVDFLFDAASRALDAKEAELGGATVARDHERRVLLRAWCRLWRDQMTDLDSRWDRVEVGGEAPVFPSRGSQPLGRYESFALQVSRDFDARLAELPRAGVRALFRARPPSRVRR